MNHAPLTVQIPHNGVAVFLSFDNYTELDKKNNKEAVFHISIEDSEITIRGDQEEIKELANGICPVFDVQINPNPMTPHDFIAVLLREPDGKFPKGIVRILDVAHKGSMTRRVYLQIGERSMSFGTHSSESALNYGLGLVEFFGLVKKRKGEEYTGALKL